jgi:hypothetical protein
MASFASASSVIGYSASQGASQNSNYALSLNDFNPSLGTLTGVTLYFMGQLNQTTLTITSSETTTAVFDYSSTVNLVKTFVNSANSADKFTGENIQVFDTGIGSALGNCSANPSTNVPVASTYGCSGITLAANGTTGNLGGYSLANTNTSYGLSTGTGTVGVFGVKLTGTALSDYIGSGTFTLSGTTQGTTSGDEQGSGATNDTVIDRSTLQYAAEVDYTYTPAGTTPEPTTMVLLGSALVGLGVLRKRVSQQ